jgi:hypothetical protein
MEKAGLSPSARTAAAVAFRIPELMGHRAVIVIAAGAPTLAPSQIGVTNRASKRN